MKTDAALGSWLDDPQDGSAWHACCLLELGEGEFLGNWGIPVRSIGLSAMGVAKAMEPRRVHLSVILLALLSIGTVLPQETPLQQGENRKGGGNQAVSDKEPKAVFAHTEAVIQCIHDDESEDEDPAKGFEWIEALSTEVQRRGASRTEALSVGSILYPQDTVVTGPKTIAQLRFSDGTLVVAGRDTRVRIAERQVVGLTVRTSLVLYQGIIRVRASRFAARGTMILKTPVAVFDFAEASGLVVRHSMVGNAVDNACTVGVLISGHVIAHKAGFALDEKAFNLIQPGDVAHLCAMGHAKEAFPERYDEKGLLNLTDEVPFFVSGKAQGSDGFELPRPLTGLPSLIGGEDDFPELPGVLVLPPLILETPPFDFTPSVPVLIPVDEISP